MPTGYSYTAARRLYIGLTLAFNTGMYVPDSTVASQGWTVPGDVNSVPAPPPADPPISLYLLAWQPNIAYAATARVLNPAGQIVSANSTHTGGGTYSPANWTIVNDLGVGVSLPATVVSRTTAYTAAVGELVLCDATAGAFTVTLPTLPAVGALVGVKKTDATVNQITIAPASGGTIDGDANATTITKSAGAEFEHVGANVWQIAAVTLVSAGAVSGITSVTAADTSIVVAGTATAPTVSVGAVPESKVTGLVTDLAAKVPLSTATAKGDLLAATAAATIARVGVGTDGQVLTADTTQAQGVSWVTPGGLPGYGFTGGAYYQTTGTGWNAVALVNGVMEGGYFPVPAGRYFNRIGVVVYFAGSTGSVIRLGIYNVDSGGYPSTLVLDAGTVVSTAGGTYQLTILQALAAGIYVLALVSQGAPTTAPSPFVWNFPGNDLVPSPTTAALLGYSDNTTNLFTASGITGALPATWPTPTPTNANHVPRIFLRSQ